MGNHKIHSPHARGYGERHKRMRRVLIARMAPEEKCWWCGRPMYEKAEHNWDRRPLAADHLEPYGARNKKQAGRLLHFTCNSQRQDGRNDYRRPAVTGEPLGKPAVLATKWRWG